MRYDVIIIGGGIVGLSTGLALINNYPNLKLLILEKEKSWSSHQTGHNSGVIHSGIYYKPGSMKATLAQKGGKLLIDYCKRNDIKIDICGKLITATKPKQLPLLDNLYHRGLQNGLAIRKIQKEEFKEIEPYMNGIAAIQVPMAGIVDYKQVSASIAKEIASKGGELKLATQVVDIHESKDSIEVVTNQGSFTTSYLVNCAGLFCDRVAKLAGIDPRMKIIPFRGEYYTLKESKSYLVKNLIYPVPDPNFPFLGVHLTRMINGEIHAGPNAVMAFKREGYKKTDFSLRDTLDTLTYPAFWKIASSYIGYGLNEYYRSFSKTAFLNALRELVPDIEESDIVPAEAGVRAQALTIDGKLIDDFLILKSSRSIHVCNAPSPAATASIAIGNEIVNYLNTLEKFDYEHKMVQSI